MELNSPVISVVMCTYNGEKYLRQQIESILNQTYSRFQLIINDDASTDNTIQILEEYVRRDDRIQLFVNSHNEGFNKNFEIALQKATTDWIALADQDDVWHEQKLNSLVGQIEKDSWLIHSYNAEFFENQFNNKKIDKSRIRFEGNNVQQLFFYNTITGHTILLNKNILGHAFPFPSNGYYDWWLGVQAAVHSKVKIVHQPLVYYRQHSHNISRHFNRNQSKENKEAFFSERIQILRNFLRITSLPQKDKELLAKFIQLIEKEWSKKFSWPVFLFFLQNARTAFYFRKKNFMPWYYLKYSFQRATMQIKYWV